MRSFRRRRWPSQLRFPAAGSEISLTLAKKSSVALERHSKECRKAGLSRRAAAYSRLRKQLKRIGGWKIEKRSVSWSWGQIFNFGGIDLNGTLVGKLGGPSATTLAKMHTPKRWLHLTAQALSWKATLLVAC
jgi:hypothetical protein